MNTLNRKAWGDLTRHRTRTLLAAGTLAIAIASLGFLAVPGLLNAAMNGQVQQGRLNDVAVSTRVTGLTTAQLGALGRLPGVAAVSADLSYVTTTTTAGGTQNIVIDGGGLASAAVNTVQLMSGRLPAGGEALADVADAKAAGYTVPAGGTLGVRAASGATTVLRVSGTGLNLAYTPGANSTGVPVFYTSAATAQALSGTRGYEKAPGLPAGLRPASRSNLQPLCCRSRCPDHPTAGPCPVKGVRRNALDRPLGSPPATQVRRASGAMAGTSAGASPQRPDDHCGPVDGPCTAQVR